MSTELLEDFWQLLESLGFVVRDSRHWPDTAPSQAPQLDGLLMLLQSKIPPKRSKNVRVILKAGSSALLYVLSSEDQSFWGVSPSVFLKLAEHGITAPWALILLDGSAQTGHWFDSTTVRELIRRQRWRERPGLHRGEELCYYVGPLRTRPQDASEGKRFLGTNTLVKLLNDFLQTPS
jgi:hypothetical protein